MKIKVPHTYVLLMCLIIVATLSTRIIPAGRYDRVEQQGREIIVPGSYHTVEAKPAGISEILLVFPKGLIEVADIVFYIFIIGGAFGVLNRTGTIQAGINFIVRHIGAKRALIVPVMTLMFAIGGGSIGIAEETLIFLPAMLLLARSLGYDSLVAGGMALVGANAGFASAFMNPFTVGVAQGIVGLPLFSGIAFRAIVWAIITTVTIIFLTRYAARVKANPSISLMYELDKQRESIKSQDIEERFTRKHTAVLIISVLALGVLAIGAIPWYILNAPGNGELSFPGPIIHTVWVNDPAIIQTIIAFTLAASTRSSSTDMPNLCSTRLTRSSWSTRFRSTTASSSISTRG